MKTDTENLLLIFTRNPELGKCKTRLARTLGNNTALEIYKFLLAHTVNTTQGLKCAKYVYYSEEIWDNDIWNPKIFSKKLQLGIDLGERMKQAFASGFKEGYRNIVIIGSDLYDIEPDDIDKAFQLLKNNDFVIGPAEDGGYYLLGMTRLKEQLFQDKAWGTGNVLRDSLKDLEGEQVAQLDTRNDVDTYEDIKNRDVFQPFLKNRKND